MVEVRKQKSSTSKSKKEKGFLGVDPGLNGGICLLSNGKAQVWRIPSNSKNYPPMELATVFNILKEIAPLVEYCLLEEVHAIYGSSAAGTFSFGRGYGQLETMLEILFGDCYDYVQPKAWQKALNIPPREKDRRKYLETSAEWKWRLAEFAYDLYPDIPEWEESKQYQLSFCDSILIAEYARITGKE